jgi:TM2 domain-containing membrane protein YozV
MDRQTDLRFAAGPKDYTLGWVLLTLLGLLGAHRFYMEKWISAIVNLLTGVLLGMGVLFDLWTLNDQVTHVNRQKLPC